MPLIDRANSTQLFCVLRKTGETDDIDYISKQLHHTCPVDLYTHIQSSPSLTTNAGYIGSQSLGPHVEPCITEFTVLVLDGHTVSILERSLEDGHSTQSIGLVVQLPFESPHNLLLLLRGQGPASRRIPRQLLDFGIIREYRCLMVESLATTSDAWCQISRKGTYTEERQHFLRAHEE